MTSYHLKPITPPSIAAKAKKAERRKVLEAVSARRKKIYAQFQKKTQLQADGDLL